MFYFEDTTGRHELDDDSLVFLGHEASERPHDVSIEADHDQVDESIFERIRQLI